ncbi:MAG: S-layer homology domain-containing protein [Oscillatoriaceae bacterium SKW80]|nr:S-layer homology domain-containing protein [Oscillatoriaceae bacterium SKYG93]MCX8121644.1 S-layer homology domain-containing protein [Oscillatoriaceae bacterium SKW80]MDW8453952.1 S-layer homology domain-containing protein [Oscillatoriaceae cyanobacterium SKYGB_i_bin93]HIK28803.1 S-layer homology domain-containing protein [Oscillatoriaceae cyanobacterium M7585_C2015_266]
MLLFRRSAVFLALVTCLPIALTACANSPTGKSLEQSLAADPRLKNNPVQFLPSPTPTNSSTETAQLPDDFPAEIPRYPNAQLQEVKPITGDNGEEGKLTRWISTDPISAVEKFYRQQLQENNWQLQNPSAGDTSGILLARRDNLQAKVELESPKADGATTFVVKYLRAQTSTAQPQPISTPTPTTLAPESSNSFADLNKTPAELRPYVEDLAALQVLTAVSAPTNNKESTTTNLFEPNKPVTRREYARWLLAANNRIHANQPARQIRPGLETAQPVFQDVPVKDPDFAAIQGLAEAGIIPSPLSGKETEVLFRPDAPVTREVLVQWKVPLDTRRALPTASVDAVQQTWGFQDAAKIDPDALRAVLADFQNGERSMIRRVFGYTTLFQPKKSVSRAEAAAALWYFGSQSEGLSAKDVLSVKN